MASWLPKTKQKPLDAQEGTDDKNRQLSERKEIFITMFASGWNICRVDDFIDRIAISTFYLHLFEFF